MEVYKSVNLMLHWTDFPGGGGAWKRGRLTNSTAVKRMDSAREKMIHQNFQSFGTPWGTSDLVEDEEDDNDSTTELAILRVR
jgi:hypothetical protein